MIIDISMNAELSFRSLCFGIIYCFVLSLLFVPLNCLAAEVLQVRSASLLQIGDRNRNYTVRLACLEVGQSDEEATKDWLKSQLRRRTKVNLKPKGSFDGVLLARVDIVQTQTNIAEAIAKKGLGRLTC